MAEVPGVHLLSGMGNAFLVEEENGLVLIDSGGPGRITGFLDRIAALGRTPLAVTHIFITHADIDHAGKVAALAVATGAKVHAGAQTTRLLRDGRSPQHLPAPVQWLADRWGRYPPVPAESIHIVEDEMELPVLGGLQAIATPGHSPDHFSFFCRASGLLFAGDALQSRGRRLRTTSDILTADPLEAARSALRLISLSPATFACGHGPLLSNHSMAELLTFSKMLHRRLGTPIPR